MQKTDQESLSPRDLELLEEKSKLKTKSDAKKILIDGDKILKSAAATNKLRNSSISDARRKKSYIKTMRYIQNELPPINKIVSKVIHISLIDATLSFIGATLLRPRVILIASISTFLIGSAIYIIAKQFSYSLSGLEIPFIFISSWILGIIYDLIYLMIHPKNNPYK